jgi:hypothetical protein
MARSDWPVSSCRIGGTLSRLSAATVSTGLRSRLPCAFLAASVLRGGCEGHSASNPQAIFGRGEDPYSAGGIRGEHGIAELCRREGIAESLYYNWSKEFLEAGKRRLAGDTARAATSSEVKDLRQEAKALKEVVAEQALECPSSDDLRPIRYFENGGSGSSGVRV